MWSKYWFFRKGLCSSRSLHWQMYPAYQSLLSPNPALQVNRREFAHFRIKLHPHSFLPFTCLTSFLLKKPHLFFQLLRVWYHDKKWINTTAAQGWTGVYYGSCFFDRRDMGLQSSNICTLMSLCKAKQTNYMSQCWWLQEKWEKMRKKHSSRIKEEEPLVLYQVLPNVLNIRVTKSEHSATERLGKRSETLELPDRWAGASGTST